MKALLVYVPSRTGFGSRIIPLGPMAVANILADSGLEVRIFDMLFDGDTDKLLDEVGSFRPDIVGYSGIASSYPKAKEVSLRIREKFKGIIHLAGGPLSSTCELMLENGVADYVVHGEAEVSLTKLLSFFNGRHPLEDIGGISYLKDGRVVRTGQGEQVEDLDSIKFPAYHYVDMSRYFDSLSERVGIYGYSITGDKELASRMNRFILSGRDKFINVIASRGCTHACLFCYRHVKGIRRHSVGYVMRHLRRLVDDFGVGGAYFSDELFNSDAGWVYDFCDAVEGEFKGEFFYIVGGARANKVDRKLLKRLKETGCLEISYGQESGSDRILKEYRKGVSVKQNIEATRMSKEAGLFTPVQLVIGSPAETTGTILETLRFIKKVDAFFHETSVNYLIPMPETPIWRQVAERGVIGDVEGYLERVARYGGSLALGLNLTASSGLVWKSWLALIYRRTFLNEAARRRNPLLYVYQFFFGGVIALFLSKRAGGLIRKLSGGS